MKFAQMTMAMSLAALLAGCGAGDGDSIVGPVGGGGDTPAPISESIDEQIRAACVTDGVTTLTAPATPSPELVALGKALFYDKELSGNRDISCATCHHPTTGSGDDLPVPIGTGGTGLGSGRLLSTGNLIPRNAPHVFNGAVAEVTSMFWDSRLTRDPTTGIFQTPEAGLNGASPALADHVAPLSSALAAQAMFPVTSGHEMRGDPGTNEIADAADNAGVWSALMFRLVGTEALSNTGLPIYRSMFQAAYPSVASLDDLTFGHAAEAIAAYEGQAFSALNSPFDDYLRGDDSALSDQQKRGAMLFFGAARCSQCHSGPLLSDNQHHGIAAPQVGPGKNQPFDDLGRALETLDADDEYTFRTPSLRNIALTAPYTHSGAYLTLEGVVRHHLYPENALLTYNQTDLPLLFESTVDFNAARQGRRIAQISPILTTPIPLTDAEVADLIAFLHALTDPASVNLLDEIPDSVPSGLPVPD